MERFDPKAFRGKKACVLGLGRSGLAAARLLVKKGFKVFVSDQRPKSELREAAAALPKGARWEGDGHGDGVLRCAFAVKSPGIAPEAPVLARLRKAGIPVFSEVEMALAFCPSAEVVAVTGTNGKTTTTELAAAAFRAARRRVHVGGNTGTPLSSFVSKVKRKDTLVLELSSYQLEDSRSFTPDAAAVLNVTSDHVDHHGSMDAYIAAKARVFRGQGPAQTCVFNAGDPIALRMARECRAARLFFGRSPSTTASAWIEKKAVMLRLPGWKKALRVTPPPIPGEHNLENAMAAALLAAARGVKPSAISKAFRAFKGVEHRLEDCGRANGLLCVNDSKATNVDSTLAALRSLPERSGRILLVLGGLAKPGGFAALRPAVSGAVKAVLTIGSAAAKVEHDLAGACHIFPCGTLAVAVDTALKIGSPGDTLLLSPACASMDQFKDFEDRGRAFKRLLDAAGGRKA